jgi:zinc transport system substrate-binding protein
MVSIVKSRTRGAGTMALPLVLLALLLALSAAAGCTGAENETPDADTLTVIVTIPPQAEFVEAVGGDRVRVVVMVPPGASPHTYEPTPGQLTEVNNAALYAKVGSGIEFERAWMEKIAGLNPGMQIVDCSEGVELIASGQGEGTDPHIWTSPRNAKVMVENIRTGLCTVDPEYCDYYRQNAAAYEENLSALDREIEDSVAGMQNRQILVYHPAWAYFARDYNLTQIAIEEEGKEPTPQGIQHLITEAKEKNITVIFAEPEFSTRSAEVIADEIGGEVVLVSPLERDYIANMQRVAAAFAGSATG